VIPDDFVLTPTMAHLNLSHLEGLGNCTAIWEEWNTLWEDRIDLQSCYQDIWLHRQCPDIFCPANRFADLDYNYLGAITTTQKATLVWTTRAVAFLSFGGSCYILFDILSHKKVRETVYHQLLIGMACFDIITAVAWCVATAPIDKEKAGHVYGAIGTAGTCKAQAFFIQLGFTSMFYNVSLALYYVLVVAHGWRESRLKGVRHFMHAVPLLIGFGLAFEGIPIYHWMEYACHILPPPEGTLWSALVFVVVPLGISIISITA
jgi:hypothetical protein